jgi:hypothetical protein
MFNTNVGAGAVGAGDASRYGFGSDQKMRSGSATLLFNLPAAVLWFVQFVGSNLTTALVEFTVWFAALKRHYHEKSLLILRSSFNTSIG